MNKIETVEQQPLVRTTGEWTPVAWIPPDDLDFETWESVGSTLSQISKSIHWWIGDWLNAGEHKWGEKYAQAIDLIGEVVTFVEGTLRNDAFVSSRIPLSLRNDKLSWTHHYLVAGFDDVEQRGEWLDRAEDGGWSTRELRQRLKDYRNSQAAPQLPDAHFSDNGRVTEPAPIDNVIEPPSPVEWPQAERSAEPVVEIVPTHNIGAWVECPACGHRWPWRNGES